MKIRWFLFLILGAAGAALAQEDSFAFIPDGGRTILEPLLQSEPALTGKLTEKRGAADWLSAVASGELPGVKGLDDWQAQTLADYLAYAAPIDPAVLPPDGRDMTLARCQSCHIVTVVVTQARAKAAWLGTMAKPSHVGVPLTPAERDQLADYLSVNAGIPIDAIPPELRAGGASY
jgi:mono/diheme cytochrome c family protein